MTGVSDSLAELGFACEEDRGSVLARVPGPGEGSVLLHVRHGCHERLLELVARHAQSPPVGLEVLVSSGGAAWPHLQSRVGFVFDERSARGDIVVAAPARHRLAGIFTAHAGGAILAASRAVAGTADVHVTAIAGSAERCRVEAEAADVDAITAMIERLTDAANVSDCECDLDVVLDRPLHAYHAAPRSAALALAREALQRAGYTPREITSHEPSDAAALQAAGIDCVGLATSCGAAELGLLLTAAA